MCTLLKISVIFCLHDNIFICNIAEIVRKVMSKNVKIAFKTSLFFFFEQRWPNFHKSESMHCVSNFILLTNCITILIIKIHYFILTVLASSG